jgi:hypothetical protein
VAVGAVLEADRHREAGGELAMHLAFRGPGADRHPRREIGNVLRNLRIEKLRRRGHAHVVDVEQQPPGEAQPLVDVIALVEVGIVDEALPPDRGPRFLEVGAHHQQQMAGVTLRQRHEPAGVLERGLRIVNRTGPDDHHQARVGAIERVADCGPCGGHDMRRTLADWNFLEQNGRRNQRADLRDPEIVYLAEHP